MSKLRPYADLKYKARTYVDKDGKEKGVWVAVGTLFSTEHGSNMAIKLDSMPVGNEWNGWISVFPKSKPDSQPAQTQDVVAEVPDGEVDLSGIAF